MKKYAPIVLCVLFVMLASALRHIVLPHAASAAVQYGSASRIAEPAVREEAGVPVGFDV